MAKIADADKMRAGKLDSAWAKAVWVGRVDRSNEHLLLTTKGCIRSRVVRRIPDGNQASYHAEVQGLPWDTLKGSAEMLRNALVRPGEHPLPCGVMRFHHTTINSCWNISGCNFLRSHFRVAGPSFSFARHGCCHR